MHVELGNYMRLTRAGECAGGWGGGRERESAENGIGILSISAGECGVRDHTVLIGILATWL